MWYGTHCSPGMLDDDTSCIGCKLHVGVSHATFRASETVSSNTRHDPTGLQTALITECRFLLFMEWEVWWRIDSAH